MNNPIFICGTGRCGTTILQQILSKHKNIYSMQYEGRFIVSDHGLINILKSNDDDNLDIFKEKMLNDWYISKVYNKGMPNEYAAGLCANIDKSSIESLLDKFHARLNQANNREQLLVEIASFITEFYQIQMSATAKTRWLEKTPSNMLFMEELLEIFPNAKLIHIIRDGRDVASSIIRRNFWPIWKNPKIDYFNTSRKMTVKNCSIFWRDFLTFGLNSGKQIGQRNYFEVKFENLVQDTESELQRICTFIDEDIDYNSLTVDLSNSNIGSWKDTFSDSDNEDFKQEAGELLISLGYEENNNW